MGLSYLRADSAQLLLGIGFFDVDRVHRQLQLQAEYRPAPHIDHLRTLVGLFVTQKSSLFAYGGVAYDILLGQHWILTPSFAPGLYYRGNGKRLGYPLEFRSAIELNYLLFRRGDRIGLQLYHISNASLGDRNPGEQTLLLIYSLPLP